MYPKAEEDAPLHGQATGFPMSGGGGGGGGYYQAGGATAAFAVQAQPPVAAWSTGLCDCFDDCGNCKQDSNTTDYTSFDLGRFSFGWVF